MKGIFLLLGSNIGDRLIVLGKAGDMITQEIGIVVRRSSVYVSEAWGIRNQPNFLNQVLEVESGLEPMAVLEKAQLIENRLGRRRKIKWGERIIDIDILYFGDLVVTSKRLTIPHPYISSRRFTLTPLCEIAPSLIHPVLKKDQCTLLLECTDDLSVARMQGEEDGADDD